jgi:hypothetical protein
MLLTGRENVITALIAKNARKQVRRTLAINEKKQNLGLGAGTYRYLP